MRESSVDLEKAVTELVQKWERLTRWNKPLFVQSEIFWVYEEGPYYQADLSCDELDRYDIKHFPTSRESLKWLADQLHDMLDEEFRRQYAEQERAEITESE